MGLIYSTFAPAIVSFQPMRKSRPSRSIAIALLPALLALIVQSAPAAEPNGQRLFQQNCAECHQSDGQGINNIYPALAGNETVLGSGVDVALVLIVGRGEMPSFAGSLASADMAAVINFIRNAWGNSGADISADTIDSLQ